MKHAVSCLAAIAGLVFAAPVLAGGDAAVGEKIFKKCQACHAVGAGAANKVGPALNGIVGAPAGQVEGFRYSAGLMEVAEGGLVWDEPTLSAFLAKPKDVVPKTKMTFAGLRKDAELADIIAYLSTFQ